MGETRGLESSGPRIVWYVRTPGYNFFPAAHAVEVPAAAEPADWKLRDSLAPSKYALPYAPRVTGLEHQWALFRRGDSTLAVAGYDLSARGAADTVFAAGVAEVALALARDEHTPPVVARRAAPELRGTLTATAPWRPAIVGIEAFAAGGRGAARGRSGAGVPVSDGADGLRHLTMSDVLLLDAADPADEPPATLADALPRVRPSVRVRRGERVGLFWEAYGLPARAEEAIVTLGVTRDRVSWRRRTAEALHLVRRPAPVRLRWAALPGNSAPGVAAGGVTLGLEGLEPGAYRVEVTLRTARGESARAVRRLVIER